MTFHLSNLSYRYRRDDRPALNNVCLDIPTGQTTAVLGMSASGKTTLLNVLGLLAAGRRAPRTVFYRNGKEELDYASLSASRQARIRLEHFGFVLQSSYLLPNFTCAHNVELPLVLLRRPRKQRAETLRRLVEKVDSAPVEGQPSSELAARLSRRPSQVSGGQRQRMAVLRAIIHDPPVVFADEPFASLDPHNTELVTSLLLAWREGKLNPESPDRTRTLLVVTHNIDLAFNNLATRFVLLRQGSVVEGRVLTKEDLPRGVEQIREVIEPLKGNSP